MPAALPVTLAQATAGQDVTARALALSDASDGSPHTIAASFLAPRLLPRLFRDSGQATSEAQAALTSAEKLIVLLPAGRYDDGVWAPIIERILLGLDAAATRPREIVFAWSGLEPFLAPFGRRAQDVWSDPRLVPALLGVLERSARSLTSVLDAAKDVRHGLIRFESAGDGTGSAQATLALA
ncbi:hypothetical protein B5U98_30745 [Bosea sp. Tri-39]|nr:hypothetical protein B5U98_30745 [Bosea sp. Tri-39]